MSDDAKDWNVNVKSRVKFPFPSFIRLFIISRVLKASNKQTDDVNVSKLIELLDTNTHVSNNDRLVAKKILTQVVKHGIKKFMENDFNEREQADIIEVVFHEIILKKFRIEYEKITKYKENTTGTRNSDEKNDYFKISLFNMNDLMCVIFQFLNYDDGELFNCSLVNSHWLYHSYNPNCVFCVDITRLINKTVTITDGCDTKQLLSGLSTAWQHVINTRMIRLEMASDMDIGNNCNVLERMCSFSNVENIKVVLSEKHIPVLKAILPNCANKIEHYDVTIYHHGSQRTPRWTLPPMTLKNAKYILQNGLYFGIKWSDKCQALIVDGFFTNKIGIKWCQFIIDNCDCTGIKLLHLDNIALSLDFDKYNSSDENNPSPKLKSKYDHRDEKLKLLNKLASKFSNIKHLKIYWHPDFNDPNSCELLFWQALGPIIIKNNVIVEFGTPDTVSSKYFGLVNKIDKSYRRMNKLALGINGSWTRTHFDAAKVIINNRDLQWIKIDNYQFKENGIQKFGHRLTQAIKSGDINLASLKVIQACDVYDVLGRSSLESIVNFCIVMDALLLNNKLFFIGDFYFNARHGANKSSFRLICLQLSTLVDKCITPVDICITLDRIGKQQFNQFDKIFRQYFNKDSLDSVFDYDQLCANCKENQFCIVLKHVKATFNYQVASNLVPVTHGVLIVKNAQRVDFHV